MLLLVVVLILVLVAIVRSLGSTDEAQSMSAQPVGATAASDAGGGTEESPAPSPTPVAETAEEDEGTETGEDAGQDEEILRSGTVGDGTWTLSSAADAAPEAEGTVHTYALRVEGGLDVDAEEAAAEIAAVLADPRGWQDLEGVTFHRVAAPEEADFTISLASPPTVDELCLPARTGGLWSCRIGPDVVLNSDRWLHATPTYDDLAEYRAYLINHEVGHFLGHGHVPCSAEGELAPVMLQQSIDLQGCEPNAWPGEEPGR